MKLIVGLGNPGLKYKNTRHNIGFLVVREISKRLRINIKKRLYKGILGKGRFEGEEIALFLPQTYMNLSGEAVREIVKKDNIDNENLLVVYDDIDLKFGFIRLRKQGSGGGHKGLESIVRALNTSEFQRLRVGINRDDKPKDVVKFVLSRFDSKEKTLLKEVIDKATECALLWIKEGADEAMTKFNKRQT